MNKNRVFALVKKELIQIKRDFSSILIAFILPVILLFLFGFGINFDTNTVKIGVIIENLTPGTRRTLDSLRFSRFLDVTIYHSREEAAKALNTGRIRGFAVLANDYSRVLAAGKPAKVQIITDGSEPNTAKFVSAYIQGAINTNNAIRKHASRPGAGQNPSVTIVERFWYNPALKSTYFVLPGSLAIIMTMIGTILTALVIAREWERGTMEALLTTRVTKGEFLCAKYIAYFLLSMASVIFSLFLIIAVFRVPFNGSYLALMWVSALFLLGALGFGFIVSTAAKDQFIASQIAGVVGFMPAMMLSGLIYEINSMPLFLRVLTFFIPARYYVSSITSLFLSGTVISTLVLNSLFLGVFAVLMFIIVYKITPVRYERECNGC